MRTLLSHKKPSAWILAFVLVTVSVVAAFRLAHAANGSVAYTYDALGRVTTVSYDTGVCIVYSYDANGNRLSENINVSDAGTTGFWGCFSWNANGGAKWGP